MKAGKKSTSKNFSGHKFIFPLLTLLLPFVILLLLEGILRLSGYGDDFNLFISNPTEGYNDYLMVNPEIGKKYFQKLEYTDPANDIFLKKKPENGFRIFVMGSSTVYGFPYNRNLMFSRIIHKQLGEAYPEKNIEVVNTSLTAINSYTLLDFMDEILNQKPDAILFYAGHNEFYGAFGIGSNETMSRSRKLTQIHLSLLDLRIYQLVRNIISGTAQKIAQQKREASQGTLMKRIVANKDILFQSEEYKIAMEAYTRNLSEILSMANDAAVPVFISEVVSNVRDLEPFNSIATDSIEGAAEVFNRALQAEKNDDYQEALELYYRAKDLDCIRFRATEEVNKIINTLSEEYKARKVPMLSRFQEASAHNLIGNNLMTEHVHPNIHGNFIMADAFFQGILNSGIVGEPDNNSIKPMKYQERNWGYTVLDSLVAHHRIATLKGFWPFVKEGEKSYDYRKLYRPKFYLDSLAFSVIKFADVEMGELRLDLAEEYEKAGEIEKAYWEYESLLRTNPYIAINYRDAAQCLLQLGDLPLALDYFKASLQFEESFFARFRIAEIYLLKADYENAIRYFREAFSIAPGENQLNVASKLYMAYSYAGKKEEAEAMASELKRVNAAGNLNIPPRSYLYSNYVPFQTKKLVDKAKNLVSEDKHEEALKLLESSLMIYDSHIANRMLGELYFKNNKIDEALDHFKKVYNEFRFDPVFLYDLCLLYLERGENENARAIFEELEVMDPGFSGLQELREKLY